MTSRACWLTTVAIIWSLSMAAGLMFGPASAWSSSSYDPLRWVPEALWAGWFGLVSVLGLASVVAHHTGRAGLSMHLTRAMSLAAAGVATSWWLAFLFGLAKGTLVGGSAVSSWFFIAAVFLEATGMGGRRDAGNR